MKQIVGSVVIHHDSRGTAVLMRQPLQAQASGPAQVRTPPQDPGEPSDLA